MRKVEYYNECDNNVFFSEINVYNVFAGYNAWMSARGWSLHKERELAI